MMDTRYFNLSIFVACPAGTIPSRSAPVDW